MLGVDHANNEPLAEETVMNEKTGGEKPDQPEKNVGRRKFIGGASAVATAALLAACGKKEEPAKSGAAPAAAPAVAVKPSTVTFKMQGAWGAKDIFNEMAEEYVKRVNEMAGGRLRIDYLVAGAVVKPFEVMDATSKGVIDAAHTVAVYWYGKSKVASLFGSGPINGCDANQMLAWIHRKGTPFYDELVKKLGLDVVAFFAMPMPTQPLGWFKKPITKPEDFKGLKFRTNGLAIDLFTAMGAAVNALPGGEIVPAMDRGLLDGAEFNNATSDRILGFPDVSKVCMLQSYHQSAETFEIMFNKPKYDALPAKMRAIIAGAVEAASADMSWKAIDRYSKDYIELQTKDKVKFYKTPDAVLQKQLTLWSEIMAKKSAENPLFKEIAASQAAFAERAVKWDQDTYVSRRMAVSHFFGAKQGAPAKKG